MLEFRMTVDEHAKDVYLDGKFIASIQWHSRGRPKIVWHVDILLVMSLENVQRIVHELEVCSGAPPWSG